MENPADTSAVKIAPLLVLLTVDIASASFLDHLHPSEVLCLASVSKSANDFVSSTQSTAETYWKAALLRDFRYRDKQANRSRGYYKRLYQSLDEDRVGTENLVTGGH
jgi:hypothetical protein